MHHSSPLLRIAVVSTLLAAAVGCSDNDSRPAPTPPTTPPTSAGDTFGVTSTNRLISFNRAAPALRTGVAISGLQSGENVLGIDFRPGGSTAGELYALSSNGRLYTVDPASGAATFKSQLVADATDSTSPFSALDGSDFGVDFNPVADRLRVVSNTGQNLRINVDNGNTITDGTLSAAGATATGISAAAYTNDFAGACRTTLYYLESTGDRLLISGDPNAGVVAQVGALGFDGAADNGFEIVTAADGSNTAFVVAAIGTAPTLYSIVLDTGAATSVGAITGLNSGETLLGMSAAPLATAPTQAVGNAIAVTASNRVISFNATSPQKLCTTAALTGLAASETVLGLDTRPADNRQYLLGSTGRLYSVDAASGVATLKSILAADPADASLPFAGLDGTDFGVDFNPVPDRLRVVSDSGQNLRINVDTGATTTDTTLNPSGSSVTSAAYTNSFGGAGSTQLYVVDSAADRLMLQGQPSGNPNNGDLQAVGALNAGDIQSVGGFDIAGASTAASAAFNLAGATTSDLFTVDLTTGAAARVNTIGGGEIVRALALSATPSARVYGITADQHLVTFQVTTPGTFDTDVAISGLAGGETIVGADFSPANGQLFALTDAGRVYRIDSQSGAATGSSVFAADPADMSSPFAALDGTAFGVDFNPTVDRLRTVSDTGQNLRSNVDAGLTTTDGALARGPFAITAAAYTNSFAGTMATTLYVIDSRNDRLLTQSPPNDGRLVDNGSLGIDAISVNGFDIFGAETAVAALSTAENPNGFYGVNLATGAATLIGNIALPDGSDRVTGIAATLSVGTPAPNAWVYAVVNSASLTVFNRDAPAGASVPVAVTGMQSQETLLGIDFRPSDGQLYGMGSTGRVYSIDPSTGAATQTSALTADVTDLTSPFAALDGADFGVDFNPVADRLRVVSDARQNLRINVATGATTTDGLLNFPAPQIVAAAYTQSFAGSTSTRLFGIDASNLTLQLQNPPNDGTLLTVGRLDPTITTGTMIGFDIAGGDDGLALASLIPTGATRSTLYRLNLVTGAATAIGAIGPDNTQPLRALTIQLR